jgi:hypothetical protein
LSYEYLAAIADKSDEDGIFGCCCYCCGMDFNGSYFQEVADVSYGVKCRVCSGEDCRDGSGVGISKSPD